MTSPSASSLPFTRFFHSRSSALLSPASSDSSSSHLVDIGTVPACQLLATPPPIRCLMLDYLDDTSTMQYLSSCRSLHAGYHDYPVKRALSVKAAQLVFKLDVFERYERHIKRYRYLAWALLLVVNLVNSNLLGSMAKKVVLPILWSFLVCACVFFIGRLLLARRKSCCAKGWRLDPWRGGPMLRVTRLRESLRDPRLLRYLQHVTELSVMYSKDYPVKKYPLPRSLRALRLYDSEHDDIVLKPDTLPPSLTSLLVGKIKNELLPVGVLPQSLTSLQLLDTFDIASLIDASAWPSSLQQLKLLGDKLQLSHIALPPSLIELDIRSLADHPLSVLPAQLQVLCIGGTYNQPLTGVLPASLRVLRLVGEFNQPLTADVLASIPQLEELHLSDYPTFRQLPISVLPRSMRVLRVGERYTLFMSDASPQPAAATAATAAASLLNASLSSVPAATDTAITTTPFSSASTFTSCRLWIDGVVMSVWVGDETSSSSSRQLVWWEPPQGEHRLGTLRWCPAGVRQRVAGQELSVVAISNLFLGAKAPALRSPEAQQRAVQGSCFSVASASEGVTLSVEFESDEQRDRWVHAYVRMREPMGRYPLRQPHRLIVPAEWDDERVRAFDQLGPVPVRGYTIERRQA